MIREIRAKTILSRVNNGWFGCRYNMNLYRGCQHQCIYCDSRSECYGIENFNDVLVKINALDLLRDELPRKRVKGTIGTGSMSDPYTPIEREYNLTGRALELIAEHRFGVFMITKSDMVVRDLPTLHAINETTYAAVGFTITTTNDELAKKLEPGAPLPSARLRAMKELASAGIYTGIMLMPVLPFIEDNWPNIRDIIAKASDCGAQFIIPWFGMTMRDRQREYFYDCLDRLFPGVTQKYQRAYGNRYSCSVPGAADLYAKTSAECDRLGIVTDLSKVKVYVPQVGVTDRHGESRRAEPQLSLFGVDGDGVL